MRRRRPKVIWMPLTNATDLGGAGDRTSTVYNAFLVSVLGSTGNSSTTEIPLVLDSPQTAASATDSSLADIESSGYRLRRIVGKIWVSMDQEIAIGLPPDAAVTAIVTAGIMVRRVDAVLGRSFAELNVSGPDGINPALIENTGDPWVFRRSWILGNNFALRNVTLSGIVGAPNTVLTNWPQTNFSNQAGGNADAAHVDQKTARIVSLEERLFLDVSATVLLEGDPAVASNVSVFTDLRILGSLRANLGNRRNASR